jgi:hypothetical protein
MPTIPFLKQTQKAGPTGGPPSILSAELEAARRVTAQRCVSGTDTVVWHVALLPDGSDA